MPTEQRVGTPHGDGRLVTYRARRPVATLLLSHGAGKGIDTRDLEALAATLPRQGISVLLFEQPWRVKGGKVASPPATLDVGFTAAARSLRTRTPLVVGGRSAGARSAARTATALGAAGCLALAFPLHPPGRPEKSRLDELVGAGVTTLVVQGENDTFGRPDEFPAGRRPGRRTVRGPLVRDPQAQRGDARRTRWRSWSSRPWSGSSARSPGIADGLAMFHVTCSPCWTAPPPQ